MSGLRRRLRELLRPARIDRDLTEEMTQHVEWLVARKMERGLDDATARREARLELGSVQSARETAAEARSRFALDQLAREIRHAARVLRRSPALTTLSVMTIATGLGVSTLLFALVDAVILEPLPYPDPGRLVRIHDTNVAAGIQRIGIASGNLNDWRRAPAFDGIAGFFVMGRTLSSDGDAEVLLTAQVTGDFFHVLRTPALLGRTFDADDFRRAQFNSAAAPIGPDPVVLLSHGVWQQRFAGDPSVVGRSVTLERRNFRIVGVMPPGFAMPDASVRLWLPWDAATDGRPRDQHYLGAVARLQEGVSLDVAAAQLNAVAEDLGWQFPATNRGWGVELEPLHDAVVGSAGQVLWVLLGAVGLVVLAACANVALLTLMRGMDRAAETAVRLSLGATTTRVMREFSIESILLATAGGVLGAAMAGLGFRLLPVLMADLPRLDEVEFDARAVMFIAALTCFSALLSGLPQALRRSHLSPAAMLAGLALRSTGSARRHRLRDAIAIAQVAMAVVLLCAAGLLVRSFQSLRSTDPGFDPRGVLVAPVFLDSQAYNSGERSRAYYRTLFERLSALPGVTSVGAATTVPASRLGPDFERPVWPENTTDPAQRVSAAVRMVTPGYFRTIGLRLAGGRAIDDRDTPTSPRVLMISETLARRLWPDGSAVGQRVMVDYSTAGTYSAEVVGVVSDVRFRGPRSEPLPEIYAPHAQRPYLVMNVVIRAAGDPRALIPSVQSVLKGVDPHKPAHGLYALEDLVGETYARDRQSMAILLAFAAGAIFLAMLSVYGVLSQRVRERSREIGVRIAIGAGAGAVVRWVAAAGLRLVAFGVAIGVAATWAMAGSVRGLLFGIPPTDSLAIVSAVALLSAVGLLATLIPAWRATRIDPVRVLRQG